MSLTSAKNLDHSIQNSMHSSFSHCDKQLQHHFPGVHSIAVTHPKSILPNKKSGNIVDVPLKYKPMANTDVPARHMDENSMAPTTQYKQSKSKYILISSCEMTRYKLQGLNR